MQLRNQSQKEYNVFGTKGFETGCDGESGEQIMLLQFDYSMEIEEWCIHSNKAEWILLTQTLGWKTGIPKMEEIMHEESRDGAANRDAVTAMAEYIFLTKQTG